MCERTASSSTSEALSCLKTIARDYIPIPDPGPGTEPLPTNSEEVIVSLDDISKIKKQAGRTQRAVKMLKNIIRLTKEIEVNAERY